MNESSGNAEIEPFLKNKQTNKKNPLPANGVFLPRYAWDPEFRISVAFWAVKESVSGQSFGEALSHVDFFLGTGCYGRRL